MMFGSQYQNCASLEFYSFSFSFVFPGLIQELCNYQADAGTDPPSYICGNSCAFFHISLQANIFFCLKDGSASLTVKFEEKGTGTISEAKSSFTVKNQVNLLR